MKSNHRKWIGCGLLAALILVSPWMYHGEAASQPSGPQHLRINVPAQLTAETSAVLAFDVSRDGRWLVHTSGPPGATDLWLRTLDPSVARRPQRLTDSPAGESAPALSDDGRFLSYVGTSHDVKGDIYLLDLRSADSRPLRLSGRSTADGAPSFAPDSRTLFFHQKQPGEAHSRIVALNLNNPVNQEQLPPVRVVNTGGDAAFPAVSPDGSKIAFVSFRQDPAGDIFILDRRNAEVRALTRGPLMDFFPVWSLDGAQVLFARLAMDTDGDGQITIRDHASIYRIDPQQPQPYPLTAFSYSAFHPRVTATHLFFISNRGGIQNCWSLPIAGEIPMLDKAADQFRLAQTVALRVPATPYLTLLAYYKVLESHSNNSRYAARAGFEIGQSYLALNMPQTADSMFRMVGSSYGDIQPEAALSLMARIDLRTREKLPGRLDQNERSQLIAQARRDLERTADNQLPVVKARAEIVFVRLLIDYGGDSAAMKRAIKLLDGVIRNHPSQEAAAAEALILKAEILSRLGRARDAEAAYLTVLKQYPQTPVWSSRALKQVLDREIGRIEDGRLEDKVQALRIIATSNQTPIPVLAAGALVRIGDLYFAADEWLKAKSAYQQVLNTDPQLTIQAAKARLSLAEIFYREERFRQALDLYEAELAQRPYEDRIYHLARRGFIRKSIAAGEFLFRLGEIHAARQKFKSVIEFDDTILAAHRGYIKCAAVSGDIRRVLAAYQDRLERDSQDIVARYAVALSLTYLNDKAALQEARSLLVQVIDQDGRIAYFHQTLGYVRETLETVYAAKGLLEEALESYKHAYFLTDAAENPQNVADLQLNIGNIYFLLGQYPDAFEFYTQRLDSGRPFGDHTSQILFYRRMGAAAFQVRATAATIDAFTKAVDLIDAQMNPRAASAAFDRIVRYVMDRLVTPALDQAKPASRAKPIAQRQSDINRRLALLTQNAAAPPSAAWQTYRQSMEALLAEQESLNRNVVALAKRLDGNAPDPQKVQLTLSMLTARVAEALRFPEHLLVLKVEMLDRLGLAYQEAGNWQAAQQTFQAVFKLNQDMGRTRNLARNLRAVAYNTYRRAATFSHERRRDELKAAQEDFQKVLSLIDQYGVPVIEKDESRGLISITTRLTTDAVAQTQAAYGFTAQQEQRLAEAFLSRIYLELDQLLPAAKALQSQLQQFPPDKPIADQDLFGVSLLYHRAGLLAAARDRLEEAYRYFRHSADLTLRMQNPVSSAINVANLGQILSRLPFQSPARKQFLTQLIQLDRRTSRLLATLPPATVEPVAAIYHNAMGVYTFALQRPLEDDLQSSVKRMRQLQRAGMHFVRGITLLDEAPSAPNRRTLALLGTLHLNLAGVATALGEDGRAETHFRKALATARQGLLPDLEWRAYAGLGQRQEALAALESVTIMRAGAGPNEISASLAPLVRDLVSAAEIEAAFNLAERIAELERFHRLAPLLGEISATERNLYREIYPRLERIDRLQREIEEAQGEKKQYLRKSLTRELALVDTKTGPSNEKLPLLVRRITGRNQRRQVMVLLGLAADAEQAANAAVQNPAGSDLLIETYQNLLERYDAQREELIFSQMADDQSAGGIGFFSPAPVEAIDVMETLPADTRLIRLFRVGDELIRFTLTPDDITATVLQSAEKFVLATRDTVYLASEDPALWPADGQAALALSATHWMRAIGNRKPFKQTLLALPPLTEEIPEVETKHPADLSVDAIARTLPDIHTLLVSDPIGPSASVPARAGQRPSVFLAVDRRPAPRLRLAHLLTHSANLSLLMLPGASGKDAYAIGHLAALYGVPAVLLPAVRNEDAAFIRAFFEAYPSESTLAAVRRAQAGQTAPSSWLLLGDRGMTPAESSAFLAANFVQYVKDGQAAFKNKAPQRALILFENAVQIASSVEDYRQYLTALYQYSRDSAYQSGDTAKALKYARAAVDSVAEETPDSQAHAEALLRLGLVYARLEQYEDAVPNLAEAVEIMAALELGPEQVTALAELGVVLENATAYDRALSRFQSAASLSAALNQDKLVADQYARIGRIYDLRLSQYALAIQNYQKALNIYQDAEIRDKVAQSRLNIGRCYRLLGNFTAAAEHYQEALALVVPQDLELRAKIVLEQANNAWFQARYQEAFKLQRSVNRVAVAQNLPLMQIMSLNTAGLIWWTLGDSDKALQDLDRALLKARNFERRQDEIATTLNNLGIVYRDMGRYEDALQAFDAALAIDTELGSRWAVAYDLRNKALTLLRMDRTDEAVGLFEKAVSEAHAIGNRINESKALLGLGNAQQRFDKGAAAQTAFRQALDLARSMGLREIEWRALYGLAGLQISINPNRARELLVAAVDVIEEMRTEIKIEQLRDHFIANKLEVYEMLVALLADQGDVVAAFEMAERSRARNFIDILGNQRLNLSREIDQQLYDHHQALKARIAEHEMLLAQSTEEPERQVYRQARDDLRHQLQNLMLEIQAQNPQLSALITVQPLNADQLLDLLEPGVALLSYYVLEREVFCWVVGRQSGIQLVRTPLGKDTLGQAILDYRRMIQNLEPVADQSLTLFNWLLAPVQSELEGVHTLGIIPHGPLHYLSFATLSNRDAYLVDRYALFYLPSASVLDFTFKRRIKEKQFSVLAIGNPDLKDPAFDLPFAEHEVGSIKWNFPNITVLTRKKATESWIVNNIHKFGIIHLASHGEFDPINPLFSALKFTPTAEADGNLQAAEVFGLRITADMVVLSACQTGLGQVTAGDDIIGLNRAFLYAGTHTIISSLWRVSDLTTAIMIKQFYRQYADHQKAVSLRRAILHVKNRYPHPGYWGAFTLVGDYY